MWKTRSVHKLSLSDQLKEFCNTFTVALSVSKLFYFSKKHFASKFNKVPEQRIFNVLPLTDIQKLDFAFTISSFCSIKDNVTYIHLEIFNSNWYKDKFVCHKEHTLSLWGELRRVSLYQVFPGSRVVTWLYLIGRLSVEISPVNGILVSRSVSFDERQRQAVNTQPPVRIYHSLLFGL